MPSPPHLFIKKAEKALLTLYLFELESIGTRTKNKLIKGRVPKFKKRESIVFDHHGGGSQPKLNPYSDLQFLLNFICALPFTQFVEKLYIRVV